ncbi:MAG: translation elongation factor Ts [Anaerolineaceae bacterium]|nr:translation elongation factor Ts [Anaerolineaceae bacterium]
MATITTEMIKELRTATGAGILDCRKALVDADGSMEKALEFLREKGLLTVEKRADRVASEGVVELYSHGGGRVGVMVEVNCETDFVARSEAFKNLAHELALQIAGMSPLYVSDEDISEEILKQVEVEAVEKAKEEGKPEKILPKIAEGVVRKYKDQNVLMRQPYIRDDEITIQDFLNQNVAAMGENVIIRRFARWELGELQEETSEEE